MDQVTVMLWCTTCVPGMQLPLYAAAAGGAFAERGLDVTFIGPTPLRDMTLAGLSVRVIALDDGAADFAVTAVPYLLAAQAEAGGRLRTRFVASLHQRSPIAGIVAEDSKIRVPIDLVGQRTGAHTLPWMIHEYQAAMSLKGLEPGPIIAGARGVYGSASLTRGDVEVLPAWGDTIPTMQASTRRRFRAIEVGAPVYASGLLAAGDVSADVVARMTAALAVGTALLHTDPEPGIQRYAKQFPKAPPDYLRLAWSLYAPFAPTPHADAMSAQRWVASVDLAAHTYGLPGLDIEQVCRLDHMETALTQPRRRPVGIGSLR